LKSEVKHHFFLEKYIKLIAIQLQSYQKSVEEINSIESGVLEAEILMKKKKIIKKIQMIQNSGIFENFFTKFNVQKLNIKMFK